MSALACPSCGRRLLASAGHAGVEATCPSCGGSIHVPGAPPAPAPEPAPETGLPDPSRATGGEVPPPRPSGGGDAHLPLVVAGVSLFLPLLGPLAWWLVERTARTMEASGRDQPATLRQARFMAITGTVLLALLLVCTAPILLVIG